MTKSPSAQDLQAAIRAKCLDCSCGSRNAVKVCAVRDCPLWAYRNGPARERVKPLRGQITLFDLVRGEA